MKSEKDIICKSAFGIAPIIGSRGTKIVDDIVVEIIGLVGVSAFVDDPRREVGRHKDDVVVNIATGIRIADAEYAALVVPADVVANNDVGILRLGAHPEQAVAVVVTVAVLEDTTGTFEVRVVQAPVKTLGPVEITLVELEDRAATAAREYRVAGPGAIGGVPTDVVLHSAAVRQTDDHGVLGNVVDFVMPDPEIGNSAAIPV